MTNLKDFFWWRFELVFFFELEESLIWKLDDLGISQYSIEFSSDNSLKRTLRVWLPSFEWLQNDRDEFEISLISLAKIFDEKVFSFKWDKIIDEDWSLSWKKLWQPDPVGNTFLILPSWLEVPDNYAKRIILRLDPGSAFGTGSHPSTRLCLEALERISPLELKVADIGCGSGILGIAALHLGAKEVDAVDVDSLAIRATTENALLNDFDLERMKVYLGSIDVLKKQIKTNNNKADLLICNILAPVIRNLAPDFSSISAQKSELLLSGLLVDQIEDIISLLYSLGWQFLASYRQENWALIHLCRNKPEKQ